MVNAMPSEFSAKIRDEIAELESSLAQDIRALKIKELNRLLSLYEGGDKEVNGAGSTADAGLEREQIITTSARSGRRPSPERENIVRLARNFLRDREGPVATRDILEHLKSMDVTVPGTVPLNNLSAILSNSSDVYAVGRAGWVLGDQVTDETEKVINSIIDEFIEDSNQIVLANATENWRHFNVLPIEVDGKLLAKTRTRLGRVLNNNEKEFLRNKFVEIAKIYE